MGASKTLPVGTRFTSSINWKSTVCWSCFNTQIPFRSACIAFSIFFDTIQYIENPYTTVYIHSPPLQRCWSKSHLFQSWVRCIKVQAQSRAVVFLKAHISVCQLKAIFQKALHFAFSNTGSSNWVPDEMEEFIWTLFEYDSGEMWASYFCW